MARRALTRSALPIATALALAACGDDPPSRAANGGRAAPSGTAHLVRLPIAPEKIEVRSSFTNASSKAAESGIAPFFARGFESALEGDFTAFSDHATDRRPMISAAAAASGRGGLRLAATGADALWWIPITGGGDYVLRATLRGAGELRLIELASIARSRRLQGDPAGTVPALLTDSIATHRLGSGEAQRLRFTAAATTQSVLVQLTAAETGDFDVDALELFELPFARARFAPDGGGATADRFGPADATIAGETRPAFFVPAGAELRVPLHLPNGRFRLRLAHGLIEEKRPDWARSSAEFSATLERAGGPVGGEPIALTCARLAPTRQIEDTGWHDSLYEGVADGGDATLVLSMRAQDGKPSDDVAAFAVPRLVTFDASSPPRMNVLLVSIDTLRHDRLGATGYQRSDGKRVSPVLDRFAAESVLFEQARSLAPYTLPSHATLLTGLHPRVHGAERFDTPLQASADHRLITRFDEAGFETAGFTANGFLDPTHGLHAGFDRWSTLDPFVPRGDAVRALHPRRGAAAYNEQQFATHDTAALGRYIADHRDEPFFLFVHTYVVHNYHAPADLASRFVTHSLPRPFDPLGSSDERTPSAEQLPELADRYDACIATVDRELEKLFAALDANGLREKTIVVVLADHGEEFGEHGGFGHGRTLYDEVLRVPLMVRVPGMAPRRDATPVTLADVAPTLLQMEGLEPLPFAAGRSFFEDPNAAHYPPEEAERLFCATVDETHLGRQFALFGTSAPKFISVDRMSPIRPPLPLAALFDLEHDPGERNNLVQVDANGALTIGATQPPELVAAQAALERLLATFDAPRRELGGDPSLRVANPELQGLGYAVDRNDKR